MNCVEIIWNQLVKRFKYEAEKNKDKDSKVAIARIGKQNEIAIKIVTDFLQNEKVVNDLEKARNVIRQEVDPNCITEGKITFDEFSKLFVKGIFKHAIMRISQKVNNVEEEDRSLRPKHPMSKEEANELSLDTKMNTFKRKKLLRGLDKEAETHKEVMNTLGALAQINMRDPRRKNEP